MNYSNLSDTELFHHLHLNKSKALDELFQRYYFLLSHFVFRFLHNKELTEEVVADVFIRLWLRRDSISINQNAKAYLYTMAKNLALNQLKKNPHTNWPSHSSLDEIQEKLSSDLYSDHLLNQADTAQELNKLLDQLPVQQKMIVQLNRIDGFCPEEIAGLLNLSVKTVYNNISQALRFLSRKVEKIDLILLLITCLQSVS